MTATDTRSIVAADLSLGWLGGVRVLQLMPKRKAVHLEIRILDPVTERGDVRAEAQGLIDTYNQTHEKPINHIETTRNTIFPAAWARRFPEPADLADHYLAHYTKDSLRGHLQNARGTYFGRMVAYPRGTGVPPGNQLIETVRKLRSELSKRGPLSSCYEINIYSEAKDRNRMSFPCLAHLSVHLHDRQLHMQAIYRNETFVSRAYGNFLGIAELQAYLARAVGAEVGELLMTVGHAHLDSDGITQRVADMLDRLRNLELT